jgi:F-type H+-transporting ATPase subunit b
MAEEQHSGAMTAVDGGAVSHTDPAALGLDATMWVALAMLVVIGLAIWKKVPAMIAGSLDKRISEIRTQLESATKLRAEAEGLKAEYETKSKAAIADAEAMQAHAQAEAASIIAKAEVDASALVARRQKMAEEKIAAAERIAIAEVRKRAATAAATAAASIIAEKHGMDADKGLIDSAIAHLN